MKTGPGMPTPTWAEATVEALHIAPPGLIDNRSLRMVLLSPDEARTGT
jgi:hypothetical protein